MKKAVKSKRQRPRDSTQKFALATPLPIDPDAIPRKSMRFLDRHEVLRRIPLSYPTLWRRMKQGQFPRSRNVGGKVMWIESEIDDFIQSRPVQEGLEP